MHGQRSLQACPLVEADAKHHLHSGHRQPPGLSLLPALQRSPEPSPATPVPYLVPSKETPDSGQEPLKGRVVNAAVAVKQPLWDREQRPSTAPPPSSLASCRGCWLQKEPAFPSPTWGDLPPRDPSSYQLAKVVTADLDHLSLIPDADHIILHMHLHTGHGGCRHGQPYWVTVHQAGLHFWGLHFLCGQGEQ